MAAVPALRGLEYTMPPWEPRDALRITRVRAIVTAPEHIPLVVVKIETSDDGLYGLGCATLTTQYSAVAAAVENHLAPLLIDRHPADIEDINRLIRFTSYWRDGPLLNNALSGIDMALWDIAGKRAGMPVYELFGGRTRAAAQLYTHAGGATIEETLDQAEAFRAAGYTHIRLQVGGPGVGTYGAPGFDGGYPGHPNPDGWDVQQYLRDVPRLFAAARDRLGEEANLLHDAHNRLTPKQAVALCRSLEPYRPFFVEDVLAPEYFDRLAEVRTATSVPLAVGELLGSATAAARMVTSGGADLLRLHISAIGGLTAGRKLTVLCELFGVQTAWHNPSDVSPVGQAANLALDVSTPAFGIQEGHRYSEPVHEVFPGTLRHEHGYIFPSERPGLGVDIDEAAAAKYPPPVPTPGQRVVSGLPHAFAPWAAKVRRPDGGLEAP